MRRMFAVLVIGVAVLCASVDGGAQAPTVAERAEFYQRVAALNSNAALERAKAVSPADRKAARDALASLDKVLGLIEVAKTSSALSAEKIAWVDQMIADRKAARAAKDYKRGDAIRDELLSQGIVLEDSPQGTRWKVI